MGTRVLFTLPMVQCRETISDTRTQFPSYGFHSGKRCIVRALQVEVVCVAVGIPTAKAIGIVKSFTRARVKFPSSLVQWTGFARLSILLPLTPHFLPYHSPATTDGDVVVTTHAKAFNSSISPIPPSASTLTQYLLTGLISECLKGLRSYLTATNL